MIYAYLVDNSGGDHRHYFVLTEEDDDGQWVVRTAAGRIGTIDNEKTYTGGSKGPAFANEKHADNYGSAIIRARVDKGYKLAASHLDDEKTHRPTGDVPKWFESQFVPNPNVVTGTVKLTKLNGTKEEKAALHALGKKLNKRTHEDQPKKKEKRHAQENERQPFYGWRKRSE